MKKPLSAALPLALACALLPLSGLAQELPARGPIPFASYDRDGNGYISESEFNTVRSERMAQRAAEGAPMRGAAMAPPFSAFDSNGDGRLSPDELAAGQREQWQQRREMGMEQGPAADMGRNMPAFSDYDLDGNGSITEQEFNEARGKRIAERAQQGYPMRNIGNAPSFADIDSNSDGGISADEFAAHQASHRPQGLNRP